MKPLTEKEALHIMQQNGVALTNRKPFDFDEATLTAIWLHALGAMLYANATAIIVETEDENKIPYEFIHYRCPNCGDIITQERGLDFYQTIRGKEEARLKQYRPKYHQDCGQRLDWGDA